MADGVTHREQTAPRVGQHVNVAELEFGAQCLDVAHERCQPDTGRIDVPRRPAAQALVVEDELAPGRQGLEVRKEVPVIENGPPVDHDDRVAGPDAVHEDLGTVEGDELARGHLPLSHRLRASRDRQRSGDGPDTDRTRSSRSHVSTPSSLT